MSIIGSRKSISSSFIGGMKSLEELINHCYKKNIYPDIKKIEAFDIDNTWKKLANNTAGAHRYVIDITSSTKDALFMPHKW